MNLHLFLLFSLISSSFSSILERIYGGREIKIEEIPFQVAVLRNSDYHCGGSLISKAFVLSAAHCYPEYLDSNYSVIVGTSNISDNSGLTIGVKRIFNHKNFNEYTVDYDFSILQLNDVAEFPDVVRFAKLPTIHNKIFDGDKVFISGWGKTESGNHSNVLLGGTNKIVDFEQCNEKYEGRLTARMICAGINDNIDTCTGDSGGPLVRESDGLLFGVTSFGMECGSLIYPAVYGKVTSVIGWIYEVMSYSNNI